MGASPIHQPSYQRFAKLLKQWRAEAGLTQRGLADKLGEHASWVAKSELCERRIDPIEMIRWTRACGVDAGDVIDQVDALVNNVKRRRKK